MALNVLLVGALPKEALEKLSVELGLYVRLSEPYLIKSPEDWKKLPEKVSDYDAVLLFNGMWEKWEVLKEIKVPLVVWSWTKEGVLSMWKWELLQWLKLHGIDIPVFVDLDDLRLFFRALAAFKSIKGSKIVVVASQRLGFIWSFREVREALFRLGFEVAEKDYNYLKKVFSEVNVSEAERILEKLKSYSKVSEKELLEACKLYLALKKIAEEEKAAAICVNCLAESVEGESGLVHPCLAYVLLQDEGIACACEGDIISAATMVLVSRFLEEPCFMTNIYPLSIAPAVAEHLGIPLQSYDSLKTMLLCHCAYLGVVPFSMASKLVFRKKYDKIHRSGVVVDAELSQGALTLVKFSPLFDAVQVIPCRLKEVARFSAPHCRAAAVVEVEDSREVAEKLYSHHIVVVKGDRRRELRILSQALGVRYEELK